MDVWITDYGASTERDLNTEQIQRAIDATADAGGGRVRAPAGVWRTGTVWLKSGVELHLEAGAELRGTGRPEDTPRRCLISEGVIVSRRVGPRRLVGAIDGAGGGAGKLRDPEGAEAHAQNLQFVKCRDVVVRDVALRAAGSTPSAWTWRYPD